MAKRPRDPEGYALGAERSVVVAKVIRAILRKTEMTQAELARRTEIPQPHLSDLLRVEGRRNRNFQSWQIKKIAKVLAIAEEELIGEKMARLVALDERTDKILADVDRGIEELRFPIERVTRMLGPLLVDTSDPNSVPSLMRFVAGRVEQLTVRDVLMLTSHRPPPALPFLYDDDYWQKTLEYLRRLVEWTPEAAEAMRRVKELIPVGHATADKKAFYKDADKAITKLEHVTDDAPSNTKPK